MIDITAASHPVLYRALDAISHDGGAGAGHLTYTLDKYSADQIAIVEQELAKLSDEELIGFAIGDGLVQKEIASRNMVLGLIDTLFEDFAEQ